MTRPNHDSSPFTSESLIPTVSPIIGEGAEAHRLVRVANWEFTAWADGEEPRVRDVDLADRLGYDRPRDVRKIIERNRVEFEGFGAVLSRATVARGLSRGNQATEVEVTEFWLNEGQALLVAILSRTPKAAKIRGFMIRVFMAARRGLLPQQRALSADNIRGLLAQNAEPYLATIAAQRDAIERVRAENDELRATAGSGVISGIHADWISTEITVVATMLAALGKCPNKTQSIPAARAMIYHEIRTTADWSASGQFMRDMPADKFPMVRAIIKQYKRKCQTELRQPRAPQRGRRFRGAFRPSPPLPACSSA